MPHITVHGLDFGIPAEMTVFSGLAVLIMYNDERWSIETRNPSCLPKVSSIKIPACWNFILLQPPINPLFPQPPQIFPPQFLLMDA